MTSSTNDQPEMPTETTEPTEATEASAPRSRRGILAAGVAGLAGAVAAALGRPQSVEAAAGSPLIIGQVNSAGTAATRLSATSSGGAFWMTQNGTGSGVRGDSTSGHGGVFTSAHVARNGLYGQNTATGDLGTGAGVRGTGISTIGVWGSSTNYVGVLGVSTDEAGNGIGVDGDGPRYGVHGHSLEGDGVVGEAEAGYGVRGDSQTNYGVYGISGSSYAGYFQGSAKVTENLDLAEASDAFPTNPAGGARLFARIYAGNYELCVIFPGGAIKVISSEPTGA